MSSPSAPHDSDSARAPAPRARRPLGRGPEPELPEPGSGERELRPEVRPEPEPEPRQEREPEPEAQREPEVRLQPEPETQPEAEPGVQPPPADRLPSEPEVQAPPEGRPEPEARLQPEQELGSPPEERAEPAEEEDGAGADDGRFRVVLDNFEGPFDLLLQLISKHKLDVTEVALSKVTDEFMAYIRAMGPEGDLDQTTEFLVVAATLLDLKAARLLPQAEVEDEADLALLEARDLLFARLLQYRAYKEIAGIFAARLDEEARRYPRTVGLEPHHAELLPEVALSVGPEGFAKLAVKAMRPKPRPQVYVEHIHAPLVSVREQAEVVVALLRERGEAAFQELTADAPDTLTVVARFLALLELYRERAVALEQEEALGALLVRWCGSGDGAPVVTDEFDQEPGAERQRAGREADE
ncbi:segregation/condensation protein A [Streptomyces cacaoi]|uniref:segregation/condensation protein A n=1 Tax=Streptomyces cacaoi TaxID=1898 RepID=UPI0011F1F169|nr:segregation/condensation protein A [Streptomyces cacaoi]